MVKIIAKFLSSEDVYIALLQISEQKKQMPGYLKQLNTKCRLDNTFTLKQNLWCILNVTLN